jgi:hypothetical protein
LFQILAGYYRIAYSRDWTAVFRQIQFAEQMSDAIAIGRKAGLLVVGEDGKTLVPENTPFLFGIRYKDPVTGSDLLYPTMNVDSVVPGSRA